jgi:hypothetical protein
MDWYHAFRLLALAVTAALGTHAYFQHIREASREVSARRWMYGLYSGLFLVLCSVIFAEFCISLVLPNGNGRPFFIGYSTALLALSYGAVLAGVGRRLY